VVPKADAAESFDDLDVGYQRVGFWDKLLGRRPKASPPKASATTKPPAAKPAEAKKPGGGSGTSKKKR
jgi:hypothetical protein